MMRTQNFFFEYYLVFHQHFNKFYHWEFYVHVAHLSKVSNVTIFSILGEISVHSYYIPIFPAVFRL